MKTSKRSSSRVAALSALALLSMSAGGVLAGPSTLAPVKPGVKAAASVSVSPTPSAAATTSVSAPARTPTRAEEVFAKGSQLYAAQKWDEALEAFREAWGLQKTYDIAANLGHTEYKLGKLRDAAEHLAFAVRSWPVVGKQEARDLAKQRFDEVRQKVAAVTIDVNVAGADVLIDGVSVGRSPLGEDVFVDPGAHYVEVKLAGYEAGKASVDAKAGGSNPVKIELTREGGEAAGGLGRGARLGLIIGGAALSAAAIGVGVGFTLAANAKSEDAATQLAGLGGSSACFAPTGERVAQCKEVYGKVEKLDMLSDVALGTFIAGGALALGTAGFAILARPSDSKTGAPAVRVTPVVGRSGGLAVVTGAW